jgi:hypothetical protein
LGWSKTRLSQGCPARWLTEDFKTRDLKEAKALLEEWERNDL